jgi:hypothetical protein
VIIVVPSELFVMRTARVRLGVTVAGCETTEPIRTARVRDGVAVFDTLLLLVIPATPIDTTLLDDADGMMTLPTARDGVEPVLAGVTVAVCVAVLARKLFVTTTGAGLAAAVGDGTPTDDMVGVGVPALTWFGAATPTDDTVGVGVPVLTCVGVAAVPAFVTVVPPATSSGAAVIALVATPAAVVPVAVIGAFVTVVPAPLVKVMPAAPPVSLITTGVASELIDEFTVTSGFA